MNLARIEKIEELWLSLRGGLEMRSIVERLVLEICYLDAADQAGSNIYLQVLPSSDVITHRLHHFLAPSFSFCIFII